MEPIDLRSGVTENILSAIYDVDPQFKYRILNKQIYDESKLSFYNKNCDKLISMREIINYINTKPLKIGFIKLEEDDDMDIGVALELHFTALEFKNHDYYGYSSNISFLVDVNAQYYVENHIFDILVFF